MQYSVKLDTFEGPLDLLLHLINRYEIDIYDIPVAEITEQYLLYIHTMRKLELDVASEFLVMAATLLAIKSKMLLPKHEEIDMEEEADFLEESDPRDELVERLLEYRKYKGVAENLKKLEEERSLIFTKPPSDLSEYIQDQSLDSMDLNVSLYDMIGALQKLLRRKKLLKPISTKITRQEIPIEKRMDEIMGELKKSRKRKNFLELFSSNQREQIVITFLAVLELMKQNEIMVEQEGNFKEIFVAVREVITT